MTAVVPDARTASGLATGVAALLGRRLPPGTPVSVSSPERAFGGNARQAWTCTASWQDQGGRHDEELILLVRGAGSQVRTDPEQESAALRGLAEAGVRAPRIWGDDPGGELFGGAAVLLERLPGRTDAVEYLRADPDTGRARTLDLARALAELHAAPVPAPAGDQSRGTRFRLAQFQLEQWREQFEEARREPYPALSWLFDWLAGRAPEPARPVLVHGDFRPGNVLFAGDRITGILDWEMAHPGDPGEDIAWAYRALWSPGRFVALDEFTAAYEAAGGARVPADALRWHRVFAEVKFAVISLRASRSFADGSSGNLRLIDRARTVIPAVRRGLAWVAEAEGTTETKGTAE
jgi:aminoglycoside phosphotransferase (APT) family kinase protein